MIWASKWKYSGHYKHNKNNKLSSECPIAEFQTSATLNLFVCLSVHLSISLSIKTYQILFLKAPHLDSVSDPCTTTTAVVKITMYAVIFMSFEMLITFSWLIKLCFNGFEQQVLYWWTTSWQKYHLRKMFFKFSKNMNYMRKFLRTSEKRQMMTLLWCDFDVCVFNLYSTPFI